MRRSPDHYAINPTQRGPHIVTELRSHYAWLLSVLRRAADTQASARRMELAYSIRHHWSSHARAVESCVYWLFEGHEQTRRWVESGRTEHVHIALLLDRLFRLDPASDAWGEVSKELAEVVELHTEEETHSLLSRIYLLLDREEAQRLGLVYIQTRLEVSPTRHRWAGLEAAGVQRPD